MKNFTLTLSEAQTNLVLKCLAKQPYEAVAETIGEIQKQAGEQIKAAEAPQNAE